MPLFKKSDIPYNYYVYEPGRKKRLVKGVWKGNQSILQETLTHSTGGEVVTEVDSTASTSIQDATSDPTVDICTVQDENAGNILKKFHCHHLRDCRRCLSSFYPPCF